MKVTLIEITSADVLLGYQPLSLFLKGNYDNTNLFKRSKTVIGNHYMVGTGTKSKYGNHCHNIGLFMCLLPLLVV